MQAVRVCAFNHRPRRCRPRNGMVCYTVIVCRKSIGGWCFHRSVPHVLLKINTKQMFILTPYERHMYFFKVLNIRTENLFKCGKVVSLFHQCDFISVNKFHCHCVQNICCVYVELKKRENRTSKLLFIDLHIIHRKKKQIVIISIIKICMIPVPSVTH